MSRMLRMFVGALLALPAATAWAQDCTTRVCRPDYRLREYRGRLACLTGSGLEPQSFYYPPDPICPVDSDLVGETCVQRVCCEKPACAAHRWYEDGRCYRGGAPGGISFIYASCEEGWDLERETGACRRRNCPPAVPDDRPIEVPAPPRSGLPDLVIQSFRVNGIGPCRPGRKVVVLDVTVANRGDRAFPGTRHNVVHVIDTHGGWGAVMVPLRGIPAGGRRLVHVPFYYLMSDPGHMTAGAPHPFRASVDPWERFTELDEGNNRSAVLEVRAPTGCPR